MRSSILLIFICLTCILSACSSLKDNKNTQEDAKKRDFTEHLTNAINKLQESHNRANVLLASGKTDLDTRKKLYRILDQNTTVGYSTLHIIAGRLQQFQYRDFWNSSPRPDNWEQLYPELVPFMECESLMQMTGFEVENQGSWLFDENNPPIYLLKVTNMSAESIIRQLEEALVVCGSLEQPPSMMKATLN